LCPEIQMGRQDHKGSKLYTDGSKTKEGTGFGVYPGDLDAKLSFRLPD